jgi:hypothetical protein
MGNLSLQRSPWKFFYLQTGPPDTCLFFILCHPRFLSALLLLPPPIAGTTPRAPPPAEFSSTRRSTALLPLLIPGAGLPTECHDVLALPAPPEHRPPSVRRPTAWRKR